MRLPNNQILSFYTAGFLFLCSCHLVSNSESQNFLGDDPRLNQLFANWLKGEAEISSYDLEQLIDGENRRGKAVFIFEMENFSKTKQVRLDDPSGNADDRIPVLKYNQIRRLATGLYDYSFMESVFTPVNFVDFPHSLKATTSIQDRYGQAFIQLNLADNKYQVSSYSFREKEGDKIQTISAVMLEDELWNRLRLDPSSIREGNFDLIPSTSFGWLQLQSLKPRKARIRFEKQEVNQQLIVEYLHFERTLTIGFETEFPHKILNWTEQDGKDISSKGTLRKSLKTVYQQNNQNEFKTMRDSLQLR